jgi:hypothetical protein
MKVMHRLPAAVIVVICVVGIAGAWGFTPAAAQPAGAYVDPNVGDHDPHAASLRRIDPGNARYPAGMRVQQRFDPLLDRRAGDADPAGLGQPFVYRAPGVEALVDAPLYAPTRRGGRLAATANTVFNLDPTLDLSHRSAADAVTAPVSPYRLDQRLRMRVDTTYHPAAPHGGHTGRITPTPHHSPGSHAPPDAFVRPWLAPAHHVARPQNPRVPEPAATQPAATQPQPQPAPTQEADP